MMNKDDLEAKDLKKEIEKSRVAELKLKLKLESESESSKVGYFDSSS